MFRCCSLNFLKPQSIICLIHSDFNKFYLKSSIKITLLLVLYHDCNEDSRFCIVTSEHDRLES